MGWVGYCVQCIDWLIDSGGGINIVNEDSQSTNQHTHNKKQNPPLSERVEEMEINSLNNTTLFFWICLHDWLTNVHWHYQSIISILIYQYGLNFLVSPSLDKNLRLEAFYKMKRLLLYNIQVLKRFFPLWVIICIKTKTTNKAWLLNLTWFEMVFLSKKKLIT